MSKWPLVPLGEVLTKSEDWVALEPERQYNEVTIRLWGKGVVLRRQVIGAEIASSRRLRVQANQFILSRIDARNGAIGLVPESLDGAVVSTDFPTFALNADRVFSPYIGWMSRTPAFVEICKQASEGTTNRVRLQEDRFLQKEIPLPPLPEQRRIVARIESLAAKIDEARGLRQQISVQVAALVTSVHAKLSGNRTKKLGGILKLDEDQVSVSAIEQYPQVGIKSFGGGLFTKSAVAGAQTTYKSFNRLYEGALVLSQVKAWEGAVAVCERELTGWFVSPEYRTFRCISGEALPGYLSTLVRTEWFWSKLSHATRGVGARRERTRPDRFLTIELPMPTVEQQEEGEVVFAKLDTLKPLQSDTAAELAALPPSILDKAFKGEL
jgi:type I restriction enzyme S subunit